MGVERPGLPHAGHDALPVHLLQVREAHQRQESVCVRVLVSMLGVEGYMGDILRIMVRYT